MSAGKKSLTAIIFVTAAVSACAPPPAPIPPPPPVVILPPPPPPAMPLPPGGAALTTVIPPIGADGVRMTPNRGLSFQEQIWHLRAALNVAALNCRGIVWDEITTNYNRYLTLHKTQLAKTTKAVDQEYVKRYPGQNGLRVRDTKMTDLYNYFAMPPVKQEFCNAALTKSREIVALPVADLPTYSVTALANLDTIYLRFYDAFLKYQQDLAEWNLKYAPRPAPTVVAPATVPATTPITSAPVPGSNIPAPAMTGPQLVPATPG